MAKKCIICNEEAAYKIKDTPDFYCPDCAQENFNDLTLLIKVEEDAQRLKQVVEGDQVMTERHDDDLSHA